MDLLQEWLSAQGTTGSITISPAEIGDPQWRDLEALRPDFRGAVYQFLIALLQTAYPPEDREHWHERWRQPPTPAELTTAFEPYRHAFLLENEGPAFLQDYDLPAQANQVPVLDLLIDAGSDSNRYFNKPADEPGFCERCFVQALLTLQLNAPAGGRGVRTSVRGGGPLTTLLLPADPQATLWQRLWLNVLPLDALDYPRWGEATEVLPWLSPTRASDGPTGQETQPQLDHRREAHQVHPLQAWWSMPRRIRVDGSTAKVGDCMLCGAHSVRVIRHVRTRHGGTNYTGNWMHPLTPYYLDTKGEKPPISGKGHQAGRGYRDWLGLVIGTEDHQPDAARVVRVFNADPRAPAARLWCFGFSMSNMKALCWYDSTLPVHNIPGNRMKPFTAAVNALLDVANEAAMALRDQVRAAWNRAGSEPAVSQSFWQRSESSFYEQLQLLSELDFSSDDALLSCQREWLLRTRSLALELFDDWTSSDAPDLKRVVKARADLGRALNAARASKALWKQVSRQNKEKA
ncbi:MAG: type I-E CRISPR-associated protein Cse1/CasA [Burkholderiales bacterium]|nr:type I-E CRISPR-associated protein Cse1/CasA [Burkholderiales bacterium]